jgi:hypothetical protein
MSEVLQSSDNHFEFDKNVWLKQLDEQLDIEKQDVSAKSTYSPSDESLSLWLDTTIQPNAFVTILMPYTPGVRPTERRRVRDHKFYLNLWTRKAEAALWGKSSLNIANNSDRCLYFFVMETIRQDWFRDGKPRKFPHFHALCRMPARPMLVERKTGMLPIVERCGVLQAALGEASRTTPEPYARRHSCDRMRGADILVKPYVGLNHARYIFKQLKPYYCEHWTEPLGGHGCLGPAGLLRDHEMFILPG